MSSIDPCRTPYRVRSIAPLWPCDCTAAHTRLGWEPRVSHVQMMNDAYDWYAHEARMKSNSAIPMKPRREKERRRFSAGGAEPGALA